MSWCRLIPALAQEAVLRDFAQAMAAFFDRANPVRVHGLRIRLSR